MTFENHPCEILTDMYSISKLRSNFLDLTFTFVGERGNIFNSWIHVCEVLNIKLNHVFIEDTRGGSDNYNYYDNLDEVLKDTDIVLTDPLPKDCRNEEYYNKYQISLERMKQTKENSLLNPCPPFYRGMEVSKDVIDSKYFVGYEFKKNLLYVQQAIILYCLGINI